MAYCPPQVPVATVWEAKVGHSVAAVPMASCWEVSTWLQLCCQPSY